MDYLKYVDRIIHQHIISDTILISDIPSTSTTPATYNNPIKNTNINMDSQNENSLRLRHSLIIACFLTVVLLLLITHFLNRRKRTRRRRIESRSRENPTLPFYQRHFGNFESTEGTSSPSNLVQIPIEAPGIHFESVSNPRVSINSLESPVDPRLLPPPSYEEVIATNDSTEQPPPTYLESFYLRFVYGKITTFDPIN